MLKGHHSKHRGAETELKACGWLLQEGYEVFRNVSPFGDVDIVAIKDGVTRYIDVKTGSGRGGGTKAWGRDEIEVLYPLPNGGFRFRKSYGRFMTRKMTPREIVLSKLSTGLVDGGS